MKILDPHSPTREQLFLYHREFAVGPAPPKVGKIPANTYVRHLPETLLAGWRGCPAACTRVYSSKFSPTCPAILPQASRK
ncbi:4-hydroxy-tetrahydrodipicolinate synthase [Frankliniella fusca]|uniref:4-hydroxy-tetrahydrodipicolinate synthase n=1 Tax=Frankliniella fusca TaxID=407009 RepID=A0AAE1H8Y1_9NEOP|nr:4-hydroxy-tetrahydrodipicolinate synthase [Frankliniella fusca]